GNLLLALYRAQNSSDEKIIEAHGEMFDLPQFGVLWDALLIPRSIYMALPATQRQVNSESEYREKYKHIPETIHKVFEEKFDLGSERVEKELFNSYPLHLQYLDTLLYRWSSYDPVKDGRSIPEDPRVKADGPLKEAVRRSFEGWSKIMFRVNEFSSYESIYEVIVAEIWPVYSELFEKDIETEKARKMMEQLQRDGSMRQGEMDPGNMTPEQMRQVEDWFESLPQDVQKAVMEQVMQQLASAAMNQGAHQPSGKGTGTGKGRGKGVPGEGPSDLEDMMQNIEQALESMSEKLSDIAGKADNIDRGSDEVKKGVPDQAGSSEDRKNAAGEIDRKASDLREAGKELSEKGRALEETADNIRDGAFESERELPHPDMARGMKESSSELANDSEEVNERIKKLQEKLNRLKRLTEKLKEYSEGAQDPTQMSQVADAIKEEAERIKEGCEGIKQGLGEAGESLDELQREAEKLEREIEDLKGKRKKENQERSDAGSASRRRSEKGKSGGSPGSEDQAKGQTADQAKGEGQKAEGDGEKAAADGPQTTGQDKGERREAKGGPSPERLELPEGVDTSDMTSLKNIMENTDRENTDHKEMTDDYEGRTFDTKIDPAWLEAQKKRELLADMERTGLNAKELAEYNGWKDMLGEDLLDSMKEVVKGLVVPAEDSENFSSRYSGILKKAIRGVFGQDAFVKRRDTKPLPVKLTFLVDKSGSMGWNNAIIYARLMTFLLLEVVFDVNDELERRGHGPIEFEIGAFERGSELFISHETSSEIGECRKERLIYDALKKMEASGGTDQMAALGEFVTRLAESDEPAGSEEKARRILFLVGDGDIDFEDKTEVRETLEYADDNGVSVFGVCAGNDSGNQKSVLNAFGEYRSILPDNKDLSDLPEKVAKAFAESIAPPNYDISWAEVLAKVTLGLLPVVSSPVLDMLFKAGRDIYLKNRPEGTDEPPLRPTGYRHFYYQEVNGVDWLVWKRKDKRGVEHELRWQRGPGGANVPATVTVDDDGNERRLLEIFQALYLQDVAYTSYSPDGRHYIRSVDNKRVLLMSKDNDGNWAKDREFDIYGAPPASEESDGHKLFEKDGISWRIDAMGNLFVKTSSGEWSPVTGVNGKFSELASINYDSGTGGMVIFDPASRRVAAVKEAEEAGEMEILYDLEIEKFDKAEDWEGKIVRLKGETGLGKDELVRAAAHLMNEEVYFVAGNQDMEPEDLIEYQTLGVEESLTSGHLYTPVNKALHNGGWVVVDEINKVKPKVLNSLKTSIAGKTHQRWVRAGGREELKTLPNHQRARILATLNTRRKGIAGAMAPDQATQDRLHDIDFYWKRPTEEKQLHLKLVEKKLRERYPGFRPENNREQMKRLEDAIDVLVDIAWPMRLTFAGYDSAQQAELTENDFSGWERLMRDKSFLPHSKPGQNLKRAPSPRVIANILEHIMMFPGTWDAAPLSVCGLWFNFEADDMKPLEKRSQQKAVLDQFETPPTRGGDRGIRDADGPLSVKLDKDSFTLDGEYLVVKPRSAYGEVKELDTVRIWIHPEAREEFEKRGLPEDILYWLGTGDPANSTALYYALQVRALGKSLVFVGDQGTGKSFLASAIGELLNGPETPQVEIKPDTDKEELTFKPYLRGGVSGHDYGPVAVGLRDNKTVVIEESTQGKPGVMGVLNEAIERQFMVYPDGTKLGRERDGRFGVIHTINPPGTGKFFVKPMSDEFIERHAVLRFDALGPEGILDYLIMVSSRNDLQVNPALLGAEKKDENGDPVVVDGEVQWQGLVGAVQELIKMKREDPNNKKLPPRIPGLRALKNLVKMIHSYWDTEMAFYEGPAQELLLDMFLRNFVMEGEAGDIAVWTNTIKDAFVSAGLYSEEEGADAVDAYLSDEGGREGVIVEKLPLLREPDTKDFKLDKLLRFLQENTRGGAVGIKIGDLEKTINDMKKNWDVKDFEQSLLAMHKLKEIWHVLEVLCEKRSGEGSGKHSDINAEKMRNVQAVIQAHLLENEWPESFIERDEPLEKLKGKQVDFQDHEYSISVFDGGYDPVKLLNCMAVNIEDGEYVRGRVPGIKQGLDGLEIKNPLLHEVIEGLTQILHWYLLLKIFSDKYPDVEEAVSLKDELGSKIDGGPLSLEDLAELVNKTDMITERWNKIRPEHWEKDDLDHFDGAGMEELKDIFRKDILLAREMYLACALRHAVDPIDPDEQAYYLRAMERLYSVWRELVKENEEFGISRAKGKSIVDSREPTVGKPVSVRQKLVEEAGKRRISEAKLDKFIEELAESFSGRYLTDEEEKWWTLEENGKTVGGIVFGKNKEGKRELYITPFEFDGDGKLVVNKTRMTLVRSRDIREGGEAVNNGITITFGGDDMRYDENGRIMSISAKQVCINPLDASRVWEEDLPVAVDYDKFAELALDETADESTDASPRIEVRKLDESVPEDKAILNKINAEENIEMIEDKEFIQVSGDHVWTDKAVETILNTYGISVEGKYVVREIQRDRDGNIFAIIISPERKLKSIISLTPDAEKLNAAFNGGDLRIEEVEKWVGNHFVPKAIAADKDGDIYLFGWRDVLIIRPDGSGLNTDKGGNDGRPGIISLETLFHGSIDSETVIIDDADNVLIHELDADQPGVRSKDRLHIMTSDMKVFSFDPQKNAQFSFFGTDEPNVFYVGEGPFGEGGWIKRYEVVRDGGKQAAGNSMEKRESISEKIEKGLPGGLEFGHTIVDVGNVERSDFYKMEKNNEDEEGYVYYIDDEPSRVLIVSPEGDLVDVIDLEEYEVYGPVAVISARGPEKEGARRTLYALGADDEYATNFVLGFENYEEAKKRGVEQTPDSGPLTAEDLTPQQKADIDMLLAGLLEEGTEEVEKEAQEKTTMTPEEAREELARVEELIRDKGPGIKDELKEGSEMAEDTGLTPAGIITERLESAGVDLDPFDWIAAAEEAIRKFEVDNADTGYDTVVQLWDDRKCAGILVTFDVKDASGGLIGHEGHIHVLDVEPDGTFAVSERFNEYTPGTGQKFASWLPIKEKAENDAEKIAEEKYKLVMELLSEEERAASEEKPDEVLLPGHSVQSVGLVDDTKKIKSIFPEGVIVTETTGLDGKRYVLDRQKNEVWILFPDGRVYDIIKHNKLTGAEDMRVEEGLLYIKGAEETVHFYELDLDKGGARAGEGAFEVLRQGHSVVASDWLAVEEKSAVFFQDERYADADMISPDELDVEDIDAFDQVVAFENGTVFALKKEENRVYVYRDKGAEIYDIIEFPRDDRYESERRGKTIREVRADKNKLYLLIGDGRAVKYELDLHKDSARRTARSVRAESLSADDESGGSRVENREVEVSGVGFQVIDEEATEEPVIQKLEERRKMLQRVVDLDVEIEKVKEKGEGQKAKVRAEQTTADGPRTVEESSGELTEEYAAKIKKLFEKAEHLEEILRNSKKVYRKAKEKVRKVRYEIVMAKARAGMREELRRFYDEIMNRKKSEIDRQMLIKLAAGMAIAGDVKGSKKMFKEIKALFRTQNNKDDVDRLIDLAEGCYEAGIIDEMRNTLEETGMVAEENQNVLTICRIVELQVRAGLPGEEAKKKIEIAKKVTRTSAKNKGEEADLLIYIAQREAHIEGGIDDARRTFEEAKRSLEGIRGSRKVVLGTERLIDIGVAQASAGMTEEARETFQEAEKSTKNIKNEERRSEIADRLESERIKAGFLKGQEETENSDEGKGSGESKEKEEYEEIIVQIYDIIVEIDRLVSLSKEETNVKDRLQELTEERERLVRILLGLEEERVPIDIPESLITAMWTLLTVRNNTSYLEEPVRVIKPYLEEFKGLEWFDETVEKIREYQGERFDNMLSMVKEKVKEAGFGEYYESSVKPVFDQMQGLASKGEATAEVKVRQKRSLILYADDIIENAIICDLEESLRKIIGERDILDGGKIVLYVQGEVNLEKTEAMRDLIESVVPATEAVIVRKWEHESRLDKNFRGPDTEIKALLRCLNSKRDTGEKAMNTEDLFAVIRGNGIDWTKATLKYDIEVPLIVINDNVKGIYSFAQALEIAIRTLNQEAGFEGWIREFLPTVPLTDDMYEKFIIYRDQVLIKA
ncbi:MAG: AAA domain-containing protein, partial [Candidatus Omnitrophica bacterium]|nr:AAA domain-containing protein [Candidatus Omnitrophota bacterium]